MEKLILVPTFPAGASDREDYLRVKFDQKNPPAREHPGPLILNDKF